MRRQEAGFTLLELITTVMIIGIVILMLVQTMGDLRGRAEYGQCVTNLRSIYMGANNYWMEQGHWPQIDPRLNMSGGTAYADQWIAALIDYKVPRGVWICPTVQRQLGNPDITVSKNARVDYIATPFDAKNSTPHKWSTQPWFVEKSSSHPGGNVVIFSDGQTMPLKEAVKRTYSGD